MKFQISKSHNSFYYHFTALLNLLRTDDFATGGNGSDFIQLILWSEKKSSEASRSLPGHASIILCLNFIASAPALLHEVQLAQASIHVTYVCVRKVDTMYISNLYMYQKSFEVPTIWSHARKRKYFLVHPVTQAQVSEV